MARRHEWNARTDEGGNDVDVELVDLAGIKKRGNQLSAAHHPDLFSRNRAQALRKCLHRLRHEFYARSRSFRRLPRKHVVCNARVEYPAFPTAFFLIIEGRVVSFASPQGTVNCL